LRLIAGAVLALVYLVISPLFRTPDPGGPIAFLTNGSFGQLASFAFLLWGLAAVCAAATANSRPESAMVATLIGAGGISLRSGQIRRLLWTHMADTDVLYYKLVLEVILLGLLVIVADAVIGLVRSGIRRVRPRWVWMDPLRNLPGERRFELGRADPGDSWWARDTIVIALLVQAIRRTKKAPSRGKTFPRELLARSASFLCVALVIAGVLLLALARSDRRGQILFALFASFFLGALVAHWLFPSPGGRAGWVLPIILGVCAYVLAGGSAIGSPPQGWIEVRNYARALPIDWLTAGGGGAMLGYWVGARMQESRHFQRQQQQKGAE